MKQLNLENYERDDLIVVLKEVIEKLDKTKTQLNLTRERLRVMRNKFMKAKAIVKYQGERIIQLHESRRF